MRDMKREALTRMEEAARTEDDFNAVVVQWDKRDANRERKERYHEISREEKTLHKDYHGGALIPPPFQHPYWRELLKGEFINYIYDNASEIWQVIEDQEIAVLVKSLTNKQKEVLFLSAVRLCTTAQIACYKEQTNRAVRKLLAAALASVRDKLAPLIREQGTQTTLAKREFLAWYDKEKVVVDSGDNG